MQFGRRFRAAQFQFDTSRVQGASLRLNFHQSISAVFGDKGSRQRDVVQLAREVEFGTEGGGLVGAFVEQIQVGIDSRTKEIISRRLGNPGLELSRSYELF